jgi:hypothetical protein
LGRFEALIDFGEAPGGAANTVDEELRLRGEVEVDDVVKEGDVDAARCNVGHDQELRLAGAEFGDGDLARRLQERSAQLTDMGMQSSVDISLVRSQRPL